MASVFSTFRVVAAATAAWFLALLMATGLAFGARGDIGAFWINISLVAALAVLSGPLLLREVRRRSRAGNVASGPARSSCSR